MLKDFMKGTVWRAASQEGGKTYYYSKETKKTQWAKPREIAEFEQTLTQEKYESTSKIAIGTLSTAGVKREREVQDVHSDGHRIRASNHKETENLRSPSRNELLEIVRGKDSLLEENIEGVVDKLLLKYDVSEEDILYDLQANYVGFAQLSLLLIDWIRCAEECPAVSTAASNTVDASSVEGSNGLSVVEPLPALDSYGESKLASTLADMLKQRFHKASADALMEGDNKNQLPKYVNDMMADPLFRQVILELRVQHPHSELLKACINLHSK